jgi:hypothetical protein
MLTHRFQSESPAWLRSYELGTTPLAVSPETERVTALSCVQGTGCGAPVLVNRFLFQPKSSARADQKMDGQVTVPSALTPPYSGIVPEEA